MTNKEEFQYDYIDLMLRHGKEFMAIIVPIELTDEEAVKFKEALPETMGDDFLDDFSKIITKHKLMFGPNIVVVPLDEETKKVYEEKAKGRFSTT